MRRPAALLTYILIGAYLLLIGGALYWQVGQREVLVNHPANPYQLLEQRSVRRRDIRQQWRSHSRKRSAGKGL